MLRRAHGPACNDGAAMTGKLDVKRSLDAYRARSGEFRIVDLPVAQYLMLDGHGDPNTPAFGQAIETIYPRTILRQPVGGP